VVPEGTDKPAPAPPGTKELAERVLALPPRERLDALLDAPRPMRLVRALPDADLYLTVREVGPLDALPLLALASASQTLHLLDLESWRKDAFDPERAGAWTALLAEAGEPALERILRNADDEYLTLLFLRWARVCPVDSDEEPGRGGSGRTESGDEQGFLSPDGYHLFRPAVSEHAAAVRRLAELFFTRDPDRYLRILHGAQWELPAEVEEQALAWRQSRLEEHGFPNWNEALEVYAPPRDAAPPPPHPPAPEDPEALAAPRTVLRLAEPGALVPSAAARLSGEEREVVLHGLASVANRILVAEGGDTGDPEAHRAAVARAGSYVGLALASRGAGHEEAAARLLAGIPILDLFREGYARAGALGSRARSLVASQPGILEVLDLPLRARLEALLRPRPQYVPAAGAEPRDFRSPAEVEETRVSLEAAESLARVFGARLGVTPDFLARASALRAHPVLLGTAFLTALAWHAARGEIRAEPLPPEIVADFLRRVASRRTADPDAPARALDRFVAALTETAALPPSEAAVLRAFGRAQLEELAEECGGLDPGAPVDPRGVSCLLVEEPA